MLENNENKPCSLLFTKKSTLAENGGYNFFGDICRVVERRKLLKWLKHKRKINKVITGRGE